MPIIFEIIAHWPPILDAIGGKSLGSKHVTMSLKVLFGSLSKSINKNCRETYIMNYTSFNFMVSVIEPWIISNAFIFVREPFPIHRVVGLVLYKLAHGYVYLW